jgi:hypothetical protein
VAHCSTVNSTRKSPALNLCLANKLILCVVAATLAFVGCVYKTKALRKQVTRYEGDGLIRDASLTVFPITRIPGFRISFPGFDPNLPYQSTYTFKGVPKTKSRESMLYVRFPGLYSPELDELKKKVTAVLSYTILDEGGNVLTNQDITFSNAWWSWAGGGGQGIFGLWVDRRPDDLYGAQNTFYFDPTNRYTLRVKYEPGTSPPQTTNMFISIENGGRI